MEDWLILHLFYNTLNPVSKSMLDTAAGGTFMGKQLNEAKQLLDNMQDNHAQWHVERSNTKKVNSVTPEENVELTAKLDELILAVKGKETQVKAISESNIEEVDFIARNDYNPAWKKNYNQNYQKPYSNPAGNSNNFSGMSNCSLQESLKSFRSEERRVGKEC